MREAAPPQPSPLAGGEAAGGGAASRPRLAYIMSRFPKISETFVLYEILELERLGLQVEVFPLLRERQGVAHPEAATVVARAHFHPFLSRKILAAQLHFLLRRPLAYWRVLAEVLRGTWGSPNFVIGALGIFPKSVRFALEMRALGVDHVHAHFATHPAVAALVVHRLSGIPFSFTAHGSDLHVDRRMLAHKVQAAAFAVSISAYNKEVMVRECGEAARDKIHIVHCGVDPAVFAPPARRGGARENGAPEAAAASATEPETLRLLCVASLEAVKGHRTLIEACDLLRQRGVRFRCDLIGDGPERDAVVAQIAAAGLGAQVCWHGLLPRPEVSRMLAAADIFCLPSVPTPQGKKEGIPVVLMEAMASGLPVVSSRLSGIPELVEDGVSGVLVEPRDSVALADAIQALGEDAARRLRLGQAGREQVGQHFDLRTNAQRLAALFAQGGTARRAAPSSAREAVSSGSV